MPKFHFFLSLFLFVLISSCDQTNNQPTVKTVVEKKNEPVIMLHPEWTKTLNENKLAGSVHIWDKSRNTLHHSDSALFEVTNVPASTIKIFLSLMALEKSLVKDENEVMKWDGKKQRIGSWNHDQNMQEAFANSTNWFYEDINNKLGVDEIKTWLDKTNYGCNSIEGKEKYWLEPGFEISPKQQIDFLRKLHDNELPFSERSMNLTKKIMFRKDTLGVKIYGKTGWGVPDGLNIGWYVGWAEKNDSTYYFAACIEQPEPASTDFADLRISTIYNALTSAGVVTSSNNN